MGRFSHVLPPGLYAYWTGQRQVKVDVVDARTVRFEHAELPVIVRSALAERLLDVCRVQRNCVGVLFYDGRYVDTLSPGLYAFWKGPAEAKLVEIDLREAMLDIGGQEIMTADKVTLRLNAVVGYRVSYSTSSTGNFSGEGSALCATPTTAISSCGACGPVSG